MFNLKNKKVVVLGPNPKITTKFDNKIEQVRLFNKLNIPRIKVRIYKTVEEIKKRENYPFYISSAYTSGGHESGPIHTERELNNFYFI